MKKNPASWAPQQLASILGWHGSKRHQQDSVAQHPLGATLPPGFGWQTLSRSPWSQFAGTRTSTSLPAARRVTGLQSRKDRIFRLPMAAPHYDIMTIMLTILQIARKFGALTPPRFSILVPQVQTLPQAGQRSPAPSGAQQMRRPIGWRAKTRVRSGLFSSDKLAYPTPPTPLAVPRERSAEQKGQNLSVTEGYAPKIPAFCTLPAHTHTHHTHTCM